MGALGGLVEFEAAKARLRCHQTNMPDDGRPVVERCGDGFITHRFARCRSDAHRQDEKAPTIEHGGKKGCPLFAGA